MVNGAVARIVSNTRIKQPSQANLEALVEYVQIKIMRNP